MKVLLVTLIVLQSIVSHAFHVQPKILDGIESDPSLFPFFVKMEHLTFLCGGALISSRYLWAKLTTKPRFQQKILICRHFRWILTAGHCLRRNVPLNVSIGVGPNGQFETSTIVYPSYQHIYPGHVLHVGMFDIGEWSGTEKLLFLSKYLPPMNIYKSLKCLLLYNRPIFKA